MWHRVFGNDSRASRGFSVASLPVSSDLIYNKDNPVSTRQEVFAVSTVRLGSVNLL
jgi:hypothetical protein